MKFKPNNEINKRLFTMSEFGEFLRKEPLRVAGPIVTARIDNELIVKWRVAVLEIDRLINEIEAIKARVK